MTTQASAKGTQNTVPATADNTRDNSIPQHSMVGSGFGHNSSNNNRYLPTIRDSKTSGPVKKRRLKLSLDNQLQKFGRGHLPDYQGEAQSPEYFEAFSFKEKQQIKSLSSRQSMLCGQTYKKMNNEFSKSSNTARADAALVSIETSQRISEPIDYLIIQHTQRERSKTTKNEQAKIIGEMEYHYLQHKLCTREAGATLNNDGLPFYIEQMHKQKLIKANKTHKLRLGMHSNIVQNMQSHCQPRPGSYILDRMNANQKLMTKYRDKYKLFKTPKDFVSNPQHPGVPRRMPFSHTIQVSPKGFKKTDKDRPEFSPVQTDIKKYSSQNIHNESFIKNSEHITDRINEDANQTLTLDKKSPTEQKNEQELKIIRPDMSGHRLSHTSKLAGRATHQEGGLHFGSKMTSQMSNAISRQSQQQQINESSIDGIKHLSMKVTHKDDAVISQPELTSQRKNQIIQDEKDQDQLKKQMQRKSQSNIAPNAAHKTISNPQARKQGPTIIHIQAPASATGHKSKNNASPSVVSQSMKQTSVDKKRPSPKFDTTKIKQESLAPQIQKEDLDAEEEFDADGARHKPGPARTSSPKQYQPIQLKVQRLSEKDLRVKNQIATKPVTPSGPYKLDVMNEAQMLAYEQIQRTRNRFKRNMRHQRFIRESHQRSKTQGQTSQVYSISPSTHQRGYHAGSTAGELEQAHFMGQTNFSQIGSLLEEQGSTGSQVDPKELELQKPVFVINKKPQSIVVNYKSSSGQHMLKVSQGDPQLRVIIRNQHQLHVEPVDAAIDEKTTSKEESGGVNRSDKILLQQVGQQQSEPPRVQQKASQIDSGDIPMKRTESSDLKKIKLEYKELSKSRTNAKSALESSGSHLRAKDVYDQIAETPLPPLDPCKQQSNRIHINEIISSPVQLQPVGSESQPGNDEVISGEKQQYSNIKVKDSRESSKEKKQKAGKHKVKRIKEVQFKNKLDRLAMAEIRTQYSKSLPRTRHLEHSKNLKVGLSPRFLFQNQQHLRESQMSSEFKTKTAGATMSPPSDWNSFKDFELLNFENLNIHYVGQPPMYKNHLDPGKHLINIDHQQYNNITTNLSRKTQDLLSRRTHTRNSITNRGHLLPLKNITGSFQMYQHGLPLHVKPHPPVCNLKDLSVITSDVKNQATADAQNQASDTMRHESNTPYKSNNRIATDPALNGTGPFASQDLREQLQLQDKIYIETAHFNKASQLQSKPTTEKQSSQRIEDMMACQQDGNFLHSELANTLMDPSQDGVGRNILMMQKYNQRSQETEVVEFDSRQIANSNDPSQMSQQEKDRGDYKIVFQKKNHDGPNGSEFPSPTTQTVYIPSMAGNSGSPPIQTSNQINIDPKKHLHYASKQQFSKQQDILESQRGVKFSEIRNTMNRKRSKSKEGKVSAGGNSFDRVSPLKFGGYAEFAKAKSPKIPDHISEINEVSSPNRASKTKSSHMASPGSREFREPSPLKSISKNSGTVKMEYTLQSGKEKQDLARYPVSKQTDRTRIAAEESQMNTMNELDFVDKIKSMDFQGLHINQIKPQERDALSIGQQNASRQKNQSKNQNVQTNNRQNSDLDAAIIQSRNTNKDEADFTIRKETEPMMTLTQYRPKLSQKSNNQPEMLISQTIDISQPEKSSKSLISPTPTAIRETKLEELLNNSKATEVANRNSPINSQNRRLHEEQYTGRLSQSKTSQGHHLTTPTSAILIKKRVQNSQIDVSERTSKLPAIMYSTQQQGAVKERQSVSQITPDQPNSFIRKSIFDDENHLNKIIRENPPKYMGKGDFGTRYKFHKAVVYSLPSGAINNEERTLGRNHALQFSFQKASHISGRGEKLKQSSQMSNSQIQELKITGSKRLDAGGSNPQTALSNKLKESSVNSKKQRNNVTISQIEINNKGQASIANNGDNATSHENLHKLQLQTEPQSTLRKDHGKKSVSGFDPIVASNKSHQQGSPEAAEMDPQIVCQQTGGSPIQSGVEDSRGSSAYKNMHQYHIDPWEPKMMSIPVSQYQADPMQMRRLTLQSTPNKFQTVTTSANEANSIRNTRLRQFHYSNTRSSQVDMMEQRRRDNVSMPVRASNKKPAELYGEYEHKRRKEKQRTNPFKAVHKGLVASRNVQRSIQKLSNQLGSFANKDDLQVTVQSSRVQGANIQIVANSINQHQEPQGANTNFDFLKSSKSPLLSLNQSNDLTKSNELDSQGNHPAYTSIKSQNFSFNAQSMILGSKEALYYLQTQNSDPTSENWKFQGKQFINQQFNIPDNRFADHSLNGPRDLQATNVVNPKEMALYLQNNQQAQASTPRVLQASNESKARQGGSIAKDRKQSVNQSIKSDKRSSVVNYQSVGSRKLFTLPTTAVEDLRKEEIIQQKRQEVNFGLVSKQVNIKENLGQKRKGGGLVIPPRAATTNQAVGLDPLSVSVTHDESAEKILSSQRDSLKHVSNGNKDTARAEQEHTQPVTEERVIER